MSDPKKTLASDVLDCQVIEIYDNFNNRKVLSAELGKSLKEDKKLLSPFSSNLLGKIKTNFKNVF
ncbi:hypothetical protein ACFL35_20690, partial [Candidatus Riflebacteria bacterium]